MSFMLPIALVSCELHGLLRRSSLTGYAHSRAWCMLRQECSLQWQVVTCASVVTRASESAVMLLRTAIVSSCFTILLIVDSVD